MNHPDPIDDSLDRALRQALQPPELPLDFRHRLRARLEGVSDADLQIRRRLLERERRDQLEGLRADSVRLTWQTLAALVGGAFLAGVLVDVTLPWIQASFGSEGVVAVILCVAAFPLGVAAYGNVKRNGPPRWLF